MYVSISVTVIIDNKVGIKAINNNIYIIII